jgi:hypothetical protein
MNCDKVDVRWVLKIMHPSCYFLERGGKGCGHVNNKMLEICDLANLKSSILIA